MQDADLVEAFSSHQENLAGSEPAPKVNWGKVDSAVVKKFRRANIRWVRGMALLAAASVALYFGYQWALGLDWKAPEKWLDKVDARGAVEKVKELDWDDAEHLWDRGKAAVRPEPTRTPSWMREGIKPAETVVFTETGRRASASAAKPAARGELAVSQGPRGIQIAFKVPAAGPVTVDVAAPAGNVLRVLHQGPMKPGKYEMIWEGLDSQGQNPGPGKYDIRVRGSGLDLKGEVEIYQAQ